MCQKIGNLKYIEKIRRKVFFTKRGIEREMAKERLEMI